MVHPNMFPKVVSSKVNDDSKPYEVNDVAKTIVVEIDVGKQFSNDQVFNTRQHMLDWAQMEASKLGFGVVIGRSDNDTSRKQAFVMMMCERGWMIRGGLVSFVVSIIMRWTPSYNQFVGRLKALKAEEKENFSEISIIKVAPRNILANLKRKRPQNVSNIKQINKYRLPLLEIVGVTSTEKTFLVRFAFLESEKEDNVTWALDICKSLLKDPQNMPSVIVTDRDNTLMNAVGSMFPTSYALLCRYHITKNV
ncbi:uncharacterized protein LOC131658266 [Vicia villosa]|uniref:uncharacterized protein LOC131658266 n=1 Tax=Vicia villosa TaxID=3911 RepID=UPI00273C2275|nr:uncharacterized protein LOC131658266 [Vicia villosa]